MNVPEHGHTPPPPTEPAACNSRRARFAAASHRPEIRIRIRSGARALALGLALAMGLPAARARDITIRGSDTMVILGQKWADHYMRSHPGTAVQVTGGGSGTGFAALRNGQTDLACASRRIRPQEVEGFIRAFRRRPVEHAVALDSLTVCVNAGNPVDHLSLGQLGGIYTGRISNWREVGGRDAPIVLYSRENSSGTYEFFKERVLLGRDFSARTQTLAGTAQVLQQVSLDPNGIGYGGSAYGSRAKHLRISVKDGEPGIEPTEETVVAQEYPIWRFLYVYLDPDGETGEIREFLRWVRGAEGQRIAREAGYYPLPRALRTE